MATDVLFPFYEILVENIFGSIGLAIVAVAGVIALILFITRTSWTFVAFWMMFYFMVMSTMYLGAVGLVLMFIIVTLYAFISILRLLGNYLNI